MPNPSLRQLLEAGVHFGHQTSRWNPRMRRYIFAERAGIHVIDLQLTSKGLQEAANFLGGLATQGRPILFVGTKKQAQEAIQAEAGRSRQHYVNHRWMGGLLTNWTTMQKRIRRLRELQEAVKEQGYGHMSKKDQKKMADELADLSINFGGIADMKGLPGALVLIDPKKERIAMQEANRLKIPVVALTDTNCDPEEVTYVIPGNDDAIRAVQLVLHHLAEAILEASMLANPQDFLDDEEEAALAAAAEGSPAAAAEPESEIKTAIAEPAAAGGAA